MKISELKNIENSAKFSDCPFDNKQYSQCQVLNVTTDEMLCNFDFGDLHIVQFSWTDVPIVPK